MEGEALNVPAVALGAGLAFVFGRVLYHPKVLGRTWTAGSGVPPDTRPAPTALLLQASALVALALVVGLTATLNLLGTAIAAILAVSLFVAASGAFSGKSAGAIAVDASYAIGAGVLMILAQGAL